MITLGKLCIAVHDKMLAAALGVPQIKQPITSLHTMGFRDCRYQAGKTPYPAWYFFGSKNKNVDGLVWLYAQQGYDVMLCPESRLSPDLNINVLDVQFCSLTDQHYKIYREQGIKVSGYLPESLSSKAIQAELFATHGGSPFLPVQNSYSRHSLAVLPSDNIPVWIIKPTHGSAGRGSNGCPYTVWQHATLKQELHSLLAPLSEQEKIIISEFVQTSDPYANNADHVVHKLHYVPDGNYLSPYGVWSQRFIHRCNWPALAQYGVLPLADFIGIPEITTGNVEHISSLAAFNDCLKFLSGRLILSIDFIIPADGVPRFLEINKLAATFAERFDPHLPAPIDYYASTLSELVSAS